jgi:hypothetical protein
VGANFRLGLKKSPRLSHGQSTGKKGPAWFSQGNSARVRVGFDFFFVKIYYFEREKDTYYENIFHDESINHELSIYVTFYKLIDG